jgi:hypothetical protein
MTGPCNAASSAGRGKGLLALKRLKSQPYSHVRLADQLGFEDRDMFFPIVIAPEEIPAIIDIEGRV